MGMRVCIDDFGSGPSSLQNLIAFAGQEIKLDCALVSRLAEGAVELALAKSIVELAHALGLVVTAEGVESRKTWELLERLGCDQLQGFYCGEPMSPLLLLDHLRERRTSNLAPWGTSRGELVS
jgi:EAL domain-containing protein (putative c-di-GMP-specific phosphodiesterase class I)